MITSNAKVKKILSILALILTVGFGGNSLRASNENTGTAAMDFLRLGYSVSSVALGNSAVAKSGLSAMMMNPASLASLKETRLEAQFLQYIEGVSYTNMYGAYRTSFGVFGVNAGYIDFGSSLRTTLTDKVGEFGGVFSNQGYQVLGAYALQVKRVDLGASVRYASLTLDNQTADTVGMDLGAQYQVNDRLRAGASVTNITLKEQKFIVQSSQLPLTYQAGLEYSFLFYQNPVSIYSLMGIPQDDHAYYALGADLLMNDRLHLRGGYTTFGDAFRPSIGIGLDVSPFTFDFSYVPTQDLGETYRFGVGLDLGD